MTANDVTLFWLEQLRTALQDLDWAESMLDGRLCLKEIRVTAIAINAIEKRLDRSINALNGLASPW